MTVVLVHGNPETAAVWDLLVARLREAGHDDLVRLSPPGFGAPVPDGFGGTVEEYRAWLVDELERLGGPVDLVGHDWGGGHVLTVAMTRPDLLRSWCSDVAGIFDPEYVWHDLARVWQTPDEGERHLAERLAAGPDARAEAFVRRGVDPDVARALAEGFDERMVGAILPLYRSARAPRLAELGRDLEAAAARPGLVVLATADDVVGSADLRRRSAARAGAEVAVLDGLGHWWMTQDGGRAGAEALTTFWAGLEGSDPRR